MEFFYSWLGEFLSLILTILQFAIIIRALLSWFPIDLNNPIVRLLHDVTEPVIAPFRRVLPRIGMLDLSPLAALIVLGLLQNAVVRGALM